MELFVTKINNQWVIEQKGDDTDVMLNALHLLAQNWGTKECAELALMEYNKKG